MLPELPHVEGVTHRYIDVRGLRIHIAEAGDGEPVVLQHGWPEHWYAWRHVIPALAGRYRVICPDLRGHGWSDAPPRGYTPHELALDLVGVLDALALERVKLVGHDWGAFAGFLACVRHPRRFEGYVAMGFPHLWRAPDPRALLTLWRLHYQFVIAAPLVGGLVLRNVPAFARTILRLAAVRKEAFSEGDLRLYSDVLRDPDHARATVALYRGFLTRELRPLASGGYRSERLVVPTRLLAGDGDPAVKADALGGYEAYADDLRVEVLPGVGHWTPEEAPDAVAERALAFFG